jgi:D-threo-aldose 1-dehydrogenase
MEVVDFGKTGLKVTRLGLGGGPFGNLFAEVADADVVDCVETAYRSGVRLYDTSPFYGFGLSERRMGDALRPHQGDGFVLSTKVGRILEPAAEGPRVNDTRFFVSPMPFKPRFDYSYDAVMRSYEDSLQRLGLGKIDILLFHDLSRDMHEPDVLESHYRTVLDSGMKAAHELRAAGAIKAIGFGVNYADIPLRVMEHADFDCVLLASRYTLLEQDTDGLLGACHERGMSVIIGAPFNSGILVNGSGAGATYDHLPAPDEVRSKVRAIEEVCERFGVALPAAALQYPLRHPAVSTVLPGARSRREISQVVGWFEAKIPDEFWTAIEALPGRKDPAAC